MPEPKVLLIGLGIPESPRWHEGRLLSTAGCVSPLVAR